MARGDSFFGDRMQISTQQATLGLVRVVGNSPGSKVNSRKLRADYGPWVDRVIQLGYLQDMGGRIYLTDKGHDLWWEDTHPPQQ